VLAGIQNTADIHKNEALSCDSREHETALQVGGVAVKGGGLARRGDGLKMQGAEEPVWKIIEVVESHVAEIESEVGEDVAARAREGGERSDGGGSRCEGGQDAACDLATLREAFDACNLEMNEVLCECVTLLFSYYCMRP
jgi:hypothetical protein